jgi:glycine/D-amino acid oxidase-like deaminating enzyme
VRRLESHADGWRLELANGSVRARRVILATNAYTDTIHDRLRRSVVAVPSYQVATAPLGAALRKTILPGGQAASDTYNLLRYYRLDAAGRLILGARGLYGARSDAESARSHDAALREIYPQLGTPRYEYRWSGYVAMTADHLPHLHDVEPGLYAALGYNGRGVAMATMLGRLVASRAIGATDPDYAYPATPVKTIVLHRFSRLGVRATVGYLRMKDQQHSARGDAA